MYHGGNGGDNNDDIITAKAVSPQMYSNTGKDQRICQADADGDIEGIRISKMMDQP